MKLLTRVEERAATEHPALRARARAILGSSFRRTGRLGDAERAYAGALKLYSELEEPLDRADLYRRMAHLRRDQGRYQEALDLTGWAAFGFLAADDLHSYGLVLNVEGSVYFATGDYPDALRGLLVGLRAQVPTPEQLSDDVLRRKLRRLITAALDDCTSLEELVTTLQARGVTVSRRPPRGNRPGGLGFELEGLRIHGRGLGRSYSLPAILDRLRRS